MASSTTRRAIGVVKDQTSISIAKVAGNLASDLEVLIVKATSHEDLPADEKHVREIISLTSVSKSYINAFLITISKRLNKTRDWIVAVKTLMLLHRLLLDAHPSFHSQILHPTRIRFLNMSDFSTGSRDHASFVRLYALYLDDKLQFLAFRKKLRATCVVESRDVFGSERVDQRNEVTPVREMKAEMVLERLKYLLRMLDRVLRCRPSGAAKNNRLVLVALNQVVRDSFKLYAEVCDVLGVLLDRFTEMEYVYSLKTFDSYVSASKMMDQLVWFYGWCKEMGIAGSSEYPEVQKITDKLLGTLEGLLKEMSNREKSLPAPEAEAEAEAEAETETECVTVTPPRAHSVAEPDKNKVVTSDLVDIGEDGVWADEEGNKLALALFNGDVATVTTEGSWEAFTSKGESAWETPAAEAGKPNWELALVENNSKLSRQKAELGGGFDPLLLNGMYEHGPVLGLPAPDGTLKAVGQQDPFAASLLVPPPSYVQIADMERKHHLLVQEQHVWDQYGRHGMQGQLGLATVAAAPSLQPYGGYYSAAPYY